MTTPSDANDILMGSGAPSIKFPTVGTVITGTVLREPTSSQQTNYRTKVPETWKDGSPKMQVIVQLQTNLRDPEKPQDDGTRTLYIKGKELTNAIRQAVRASGANGIHTGGQLTVAYIGDGPADPGLDDGPKLYQAQYQPPATNWNGVTGPANAPVSSAPVQQAMYQQPPAVQQQMPATVQQQAYAPPPAPAAPAPMAAPQQHLPCPPNVDPGMWARLDPSQQQAVIAAQQAALAAQPGY